ncbi:methionyl-tRNA formyltransferase [Thermodesulfovibrio yellowstonii]|uniref:Methionyl-tRNA formyltransferase n=1 Tax=Thermodesulfovibrio yellowstonii (strain ATCC 51303 / DSM 11347 / YP87) TaxID=289376 RepID=FMT_THEYD|nr:methionyl-tRNA formyltransferase [Thermodesulfovibrio yellowstonii]B5YIL6.1 RecName: Full=Methionyl-tRNA formyltransferase [Thermodesulfovibrio yellowstonii DSM 11347]ACI21917.1 methionyl-tRNA formyltransferase [Thermodesulfovibrio yellowstonii DSM 11347]
MSSGIIFFGTPEFAVPSLKALISRGEKILLVVTQPDKPKGRGKNLQAPEIKKVALQCGLPLCQPEKMKDDNFIKKLKSLNPEFAIVVAYGKILPKEILEIPKHGCINLHASLLPKYRGAAPIQWALINGEKITGVTTMIIDEGLDTGPILLQKEISINDEDNAETLSEKLSVVGAELIIETIDKMRKGIITPKPQTGEITYAPQLKKDDGKINWNNSARKIFNLVRGTYPWPCAYSFLKDERVKIIKTEVLEGNAAPGLIIKAKNELIVGTQEGLLRILLIQPEGKKIMTAKEFISGRKINEGMDSFS